MDRKTALAIGVTLLLWASAFAGIRAALRDYSPAHLALGRFLVASSILAVVAVWKQTRFPDWRDTPRIILTGFVGITLYHIALNFGEMTVSAGAASFIVNTVPIFTTLLSIVFLNERVRLLGWLGMLVSFSGVCLIALGETDQLHFDKGAFAILAAAVCQSLYFVLQKPLLRKYSVLSVVCYAIWAGTISLIVFLPGLAAQVRFAPLPSTLAIVYLGVFPSAIAYLCWSHGLSKMGASKASSFLFIVPVVAIVIAFIWLHEIPSWLSLVGGAIALAGVAICIGFGKHRHEPQQDAVPVGMPKGAGA
ncbi:MAG: EamA family transporter [Chthoniobacterales bacterium]|nr:EamA family transporter [Chthoniobacterales bacterium]